LRLALASVYSPVAKVASRSAASLPKEHQLASKYVKTDPKCARLDVTKYGAAKPEAVERAKQALVAKGHEVVIVNDSKAALEALIASIPDGKSLYNTGSTTLEELGFVDYLLTNPTKWDNLKAKAMAVRASNPAEYARIWQQALVADFWISSPSAVTEEGDVLVVDASATRVSGYLTAQKVILVAGTNKITPTYGDGEKRIYDYCLPLEGARMRAVTQGKATGSAVNNFAAIRGVSPGRKPLKVIFVRSESLGF